MEPTPEAFEWTPDLEIGVPIIDSQHRRYFDCVAETLRHAGSGGDAENFRDALDFVRDYTVLHFDSEQDIMRFHQYPDFEAHLAQHQYFSRRLDELADAFESRGLSPELENTLYGLLIEWFVRHIRRVDTRLAAFLEGRIAPLH